MTEINEALDILDYWYKHANPIVPDIIYDRIEQHLTEKRTKLWGSAEDTPRSLVDDLDTLSRLLHKYPERIYIYSKMEELE